MNSAQQQHSQQLIPSASQPRVVAHALSNPPVHAVAPPDRTSHRYRELLEQLSAEYEAVVTENKTFRSVREEYQRKAEQQLNDLNNMERALEELERKHQDIKEQYDSEIGRLKAQAANSAAAVPSAPVAVAAQQQPQQQQPQQPQQPQPPQQPQQTQQPHVSPHASEPSAQPTASQLPPHQTPHSGPPHHSPVAATPKSTDVPSMVARSAAPKLSTIPPARTHLVADVSSAIPSYSPTLHPSFAVSRSLDQPHHSAMPHPQQHHQKHPLHPAQSPSGHPAMHQSASHPMQQPSVAQPPHIKFPRLQGPGSYPQGQPPHGSLPLPSPATLGSGPSAIPPIMHNAPQNPARGLAPPQPSKVHNIDLMTNGPTQEDMMQTHAVPFKKDYPMTAPPHVPGRGPATMMAPTAMNQQPPLIQHGFRHRPPMGVAQLGSQPHHVSMHSQQPSQTDDWNVTAGRAANGSKVSMKINLQHTLPHGSVVCCVRYSWDGRFLATGSNRSADIYDAQTGHKVATFSKDMSAEPGDTPIPDSYVRAVCFSPDGNWLITGAEDHVVKVWDVRTRTVKHRLIGHSTDIYSVDASANSRFIISGSGDKRAKLWNLETGALMSTLGGEYGPTDGITSVSVSPTSQHVAAGSLDKIVRVWDVETSRLVRQFEGHKDSVYSVAFSPDGRSILSGSLDKTLKLWDLAASPQMSNQCRYSFPGHTDFVLSVTFSPDNRWLISGSKDRTVQFWDPRQPSVSVTLQGHKNSVISIAHNPTTHTMSTGSGDCRARTWSYTTY